MNGTERRPSLLLPIPLFVDVLLPDRNEAGRYFYSWFKYIDHFYRCPCPHVNWLSVRESGQKKKEGSYDSPFNL